MSDERRKHPRVDVHLTGLMKSDIDADHTDILMSNLSLGGAFIKTGKPADVGTQVTLQFCPIEAEEPIVATGQVVWSRVPERNGRDADTSGMGIQFLDVKAEHLVRLKRFIEAIITEELFGAVGFR